MTSTDLLAALAELRELYLATRPGPWALYLEPVSSPEQAKAELCQLVDGTDFSPALPMLVDEAGLCPAVTGCGAQSLSNAQLIVAMRNVLARLFADASFDAAREP